jgi:SAM-dependent methyltransferase
MGNSLFDLSAEYDDMLNKGLKYSGESKCFFLEGRAKDMLKALPAGKKIKKILDFGCGIGDTSAYLKKVFSDAEIYGVDTAQDAIRNAQNRFPDLHFSMLEELQEDGFDLCYCNGVFHHIPPENRREALEYVNKKLLPGGYFSVFDNNPFNPGTRFVMSRIPFDKDAILINHLEMGRRLKESSFEVLKSRFLFIFPKVLSFLRWLEPLLVNIPMGAQYHIFAKKNDK